MSQSTNLPKTGEERQRDQEREQERRQRESREQTKAAPVGPLQTDKGNTTIEETVVSKIAGIATREVPGVFAMGSAARRAFNSLTERFPGGQTNVSGGVSVEKGERQAAIEVTIIIEYGASVVDVADDIRRNVIRSVEQSTGLEVVEVNITVADVHLPEEDDNQRRSSGSGENTDLA
ncbi:alkaline-shock protein [Tersicoccus phoenicis]|uniref:Alkaline-shock protein n=1 Tax=Tersicoccus phoenicis TaxID=554083 RepID=A0A1R1LJC6_9MICC|nr:Asp23/Gls24 family envelope stress response protein [Tersicoccus phoenicis]OMH27638.1 alkaline-shock protein [Tersicoccus phoenicis]